MDILSLVVGAAVGVVLGATVLYTWAKKQIASATVAVKSAANTISNKA